MRRFFISLTVAVVMSAMFLIAWTPPAKSGFNGDGGCLEFCKEQAVCMCAKILGGSLRLTKCKIGAQCVDTENPGSHCECDVDPICALWEKDVVVQSSPVETPEPPCEVDQCPGCPCNYFLAIPPTAECWPEGIWEDNNVPGTCQLTDIFNQFPLDEFQAGVFYGNAQCVANTILGTNTEPPGCPVLGAPGYNVVDLSAEQLEACRQCLVQYVNVVAQGGTVVGDPLDCTPP